MLVKNLKKISSSKWVLFLGFINLGIAFSNSFPLPEIPFDDNIMLKSGNPTAEALPDSFSLLVWNIQKAEDGALWKNDFNEITKNKDLILLQEGYLNSSYKEAIASFPQMLWSFAVSFMHDGLETGIVTGSLAKPIQTNWLRSPVREPIYKTPKMALLTQYVLSNSPEHVLVANLHGINFVSNSSFNKQMDQIFSSLNKHQGPIIFAGDFNTWNSNRMIYLESQAKNIGLKKVLFDHDPRYLQLDHIFYRDLELSNSRVLEQVATSDHYPIQAQFKFKPTLKSASY